MAKYKKHIVILIIVCLYWMGKFFSAQINSPLFANHFTDLLFIPFLAFIGLLGVQTIKRDKTIHIGFGKIVILVALSSFYFEWYLPHYSANSFLYTADILDCLMYGVGGVLFLFLQRRLVKPISKSSRTAQKHSE